MNPDSAADVVWSLVLLALVAGLVTTVFSKRKAGHGGPGAGATGAIYDLLNQDKRNAIELIVEDKAAARDPEHADDKPKAGKSSTPNGQ